MILAHYIRLVPNAPQEDYFRRACGTARFVYNEALRRWKAAYEAGEKPNGRKLKSEFNAEKYERWPWMRGIHRDAHARPFDDLQTAFGHFFRRVRAGATKVGFPQFKKKGKSKDSFYIACDKIRVNGKRVRLPKIGWVKTREALRFEGKILGATVSRTADQWHVSVQVDVGEVRKERFGDSVVGVDLGIKASATLSSGEVVEGPKALNRNLKRLRRLSRRHSRKQEGSNGRRKSAMRLARLHNRIANIRSDHVHKLVTRLVSENQAVGIEDLAVKNMVRNRRLARQIVDEAWGQFRWQLGYKAPMYGTEIVIHDRWFPSSKTCSDCGHVLEELPLNVRSWMCPMCGVVHDRDVNAAINLKPVPRATGEVTPVDRKALAGTLVPAKPAWMKQELPSTHLCVRER